MTDAKENKLICAKVANELVNIIIKYDKSYEIELLLKAIITAFCAVVVIKIDVKSYDEVLLEACEMMKTALDNHKLLERQQQTND